MKNNVLLIKPVFASLLALFVLTATGCQVGWSNKDIVLKIVDYDTGEELKDCVLIWKIHRFGTGYSSRFHRSGKSNGATSQKEYKVMKIDSGGKFRSFSEGRFLLPLLFGSYQWGGEQWATAAKDGYWIGARGTDSCYEEYQEKGYGTIRLKNWNRHTGNEPGVDQIGLFSTAATTCCEAFERADNLFEQNPEATLAYLEYLLSNYTRCCELLPRWEGARENDPDSAQNVRNKYKELKQRYESNKNKVIE